MNEIQLPSFSLLATSVTIFVCTGYYCADEAVGVGIGLTFGSEFHVLVSNSTLPALPHHFLA